MKLDQEALEHGSMMPLAPKDLAVNLLLFAYMSEFPDPIEYSIWVHKVAFAGKIGDEEALTKLESEMTELARGHVRRANAAGER